MNQVKKILAYLALASMAVFILAVLVMLLTGQLGQYPAWIYGPLAAFLMFGLTALLIRKLQQFAEEKRREQEQ